MKKLVKTLARIEPSSANGFADCFCAVHPHQLELANTSLPTYVRRVKAALVLVKFCKIPHSLITAGRLFTLEYK